MEASLLAMWSILRSWHWTTLDIIISSQECSGHARYEWLRNTPEWLRMQLYIQGCIMRATQRTFTIDIMSVMTELTLRHLRKQVTEFLVTRPKVTFFASWFSTCLAAQCITTFIRPNTLAVSSQGDYLISGSSNKQCVNNLIDFQVGGCLLLQGDCNLQKGALTSLPNQIRTKSKM